MAQTNTAMAEEAIDATEATVTTEASEDNRDAEMAQAAEAATRHGKAKQEVASLNIAGLGDLKFEKALIAFTKTVETGKRYAHFLAIRGLEHFYQHGDTSKLQAFLDVLEGSGKNYVRAAAFKMWVRDFAPITMQDKKLVKNKDRAPLFTANPELGETADNPLIFPEEARDWTFWSYAPSPENVIWGATDLVKALKNVIKRFEKSNHIPANQEAKDELTKAKLAVAAL